MDVRNINNDNFVTVLPRILDPGMKFTKESLKQPIAEAQTQCPQVPKEKIKKLSFFNEYKYVILFIVITILVMLVIYLSYKHYNDKKIDIKPDKQIVVDKDDRDRYLSEFIVDDDLESKLDNELIQETDIIINKEIIVDKKIIVDEDKSFDQLSTENIEILLSKYNDGHAKRNDIITIEEYNKQNSSDSGEIVESDNKKVDEESEEEPTEPEEENYDKLHGNESEEEDIGYFKRFSKNK